MSKLRFYMDNIKIAYDTGYRIGLSNRFKNNPYPFESDLYSAYENGYWDGNKMRQKNDDMMVKEYEQYMREQGVPEHEIVSKSLSASWLLLFSRR